MTSEQKKKNANEDYYIVYDELLFGNNKPAREKKNSTMK